MYKSHSALLEPRDDDILWRYMEFTKFVAMLEQRALYFQRVSSLEDPYEGVLTRRAAERMRSAPPGLTDEQLEQRGKNAEHNIAFMTSMRAIFSVSSWHISNSESDTMWGRYIGGRDGVAIVTTFERFREAFRESSQDVHGCQVEYIDYDATDIDEGQSFNWIKYKRQEFALEREFRGVVMTAGSAEIGELVTADLNMLIERIYVAPKSADWVVGLVSRLSAQHKIGAPVVKSRLASGPDYLNHRGR